MYRRSSVASKSVEGGWALGSLAPSYQPDQIKQAKRSLLNLQGQPPPLTTIPPLDRQAVAAGSFWAFGTGKKNRCGSGGAVKGNEHPLTWVFLGSPWSRCCRFFGPPTFGPTFRFEPLEVGRP